jgi:hypothetical protein
MEENLNDPVTGGFPDLSDFWVLVKHDGTYILGVGVLTDGLIAPLFPDLDSAQDVIKDISDDLKPVELRVEKLGDPFKAMRKAAGEGAAGFQFSPGMFSEDQRNAVFSITQGRIVFPFMTRYAEAGSQWPTVLGSAMRCDEGCYLTRKGAAHFGPHELMQWVRWDIFDRASAKLSEVHPFRSHEPNGPFWCLAHAEGLVKFHDGAKLYESRGPSIVLFAKASCVGPFMPPEGYYPVFTSEDAAKEFLTQRLGGAFHILSSAKSEIPNLVLHQGIMSSELGAKGELRAIVSRVDDLAGHLSQIRGIFPLPPYFSFVINPAGHREDTAWGIFPELGSTDLEINSVGATWRLTADHDYLKISRIDQFMGSDTFFLGAIDFRVSDLGRSLGRFAPSIDGEDLRVLSPVESKEIIRDLILKTHAEEEFWSSHHAFACEDNIFIDDDEIDNQNSDPDRSIRVRLEVMGKWVLNFWDTVDGEKLGPFYFDTPIDLANALCRLEFDDRAARIEGRRGCHSIGFEGSGNSELEAAIGNGFKESILEICIRMVGRGYKPSDALDMAAAGNRIFRSFRISLCGNAADILISHIPTENRSAERLLEEMGIDPDLHESLLSAIKDDLDPEAEALLVGCIGRASYASLLPRTRLFLSTALLQFENLGRSPCLDYAPVSVQIVKALEYEMRELALYLVFGFSGVRPVEPSRVEETLFFVRENQGKSFTLGSLTYAIKALKNPKSPILDYAAKRLYDVGLGFMTDRSTWRLILEDVLERYRNGGAHEHAISYATCEECIRDLIGSADRPGLVIRVAGWRRQAG